MPQTEAHQGDQSIWKYLSDFGCLRRRTLYVVGLCWSVPGIGISHTAQVSCAHCGNTSQISPAGRTAFEF